MSLLDIEPGLDTRCILALQQDNELFTFLKSYKNHVPAYTFREGDHTYLQLYFDTEHIDARDLAFLEKIGAARSAVNYVVRQPINNVRELGIISELIDQKLVASNFMYVSEGWMVFDFRFHSSVYREVSEILSRYMENTEKVKLVYLGASPGLTTILSKLNENIPLSIVIFEAPIDNKNVPSEIVAKEFDLLETENALMADGKIKVITYRQGKADHNLEVRENYVVNDLLNRIRTTANSHYIIRYNMFIKRHDESQRMMVFLPSNLLNQYLRVVFSIGREVTNSGISLIASAPFGLDVIESFN